MLAKKTSKNQLTLPKAVVDHFIGVEYFDATTDGRTIFLRPLEVSRAAEVREKLASLGITQLDVDAAIKWARAKR